MTWGRKGRVGRVLGGHHCFGADGQLGLALPWGRPGAVLKGVMLACGYVKADAAHE